MKKIEKKILVTLDVPRSNQEISELTGLEVGVIGKALAQLRARGLIISIGQTSARRHMRLAAAIESLLEASADLSERLDRLEAPQKPLKLN